MKEKRSACPIASSLDILGDRWTLVLVRDMLMGKKRYSEFLESPERITTNILADRLNLIEKTGLAEKKPYQERPKRYEYTLTEKGRHLLPVLQALCVWGNQFMPDTWQPPESFVKMEP